MQLFWAANTLNNGYYLWREGRLNSFVLSDGRDRRPDPWQNTATVALHHFFNQLMPVDAYEYAVSEEGFSVVYQSLFGDPWAEEQVTIPGSLYQPSFLLPFQPGKIWAYTGGPHTGWGTGEPLAAIDFAPPAAASGCNQTDEWATAVADGIIARSEGAIVVLDLDGDGDERTGWTVFYLHIEGRGRIAQGTTVKAGQPIGHPSCDGGDATGTHIHIARKYNGEWIPAGGTLAFNLEGWVAQAGSSEYRGTLTRFEQTVTACDCSDQYSHIQSGGLP
jgi:murein DD-endopeptidase MepM/ murein hydrolase activator NlpD